MDNNVMKVANSAFESIPFENLIGSPLCACVNAQREAAKTTLDYIKEMGFDTITNERNEEEFSVAMISFEFIQNGNKRRMLVPLISVVPIPYLQIDNVNIRFTAEVTAHTEDIFNAKISNVRYNAEENSGSGLDYKALVDVDVRASSSSMPAGLAKMLQLFENCIQVEEKSFFYVVFTSAPEREKKIDLAKEVVKRLATIDVKQDKDSVISCMNTNKILASNLTEKQADALLKVLDEYGATGEKRKMASEILGE
ncbi:MAG: DUF2589 domain-containing protein [Paludibacteraceae bacterium]|nr:DUF2589 domain-containing protein [Paludibacteraceae bacterium]